MVDGDTYSDNFVRGISTVHMRSGQMSVIVIKSYLRKESYVVRLYY